MSETALAARNAPGYTVLYKGMAQEYLDRRIPPSLTTSRQVKANFVIGLFDSNGQVTDITALASRPMTDFCRDAAYYFAVDRDVALTFAHFAKRRNHLAAAVLVQMAIPNSAIQRLSDTERFDLHWPSSEWKELVLCSPRYQKYPSHLRKYRAATLIVGTVAGRPRRVLGRLTSPEQITENMLLRNKAGRHAIQYVWPQETGQDFLMEHGVP